ncbi:hypothetical protein Tco_0200431 [Tanacetum coccineum]
MWANRYRFACATGAKPTGTKSMGNIPLSCRWKELASQRDVHSGKFGRSVHHAVAYSSTWFCTAIHCICPGYTCFPSSLILVLPLGAVVLTSGMEPPLKAIDWLWYEYPLWVLGFVVTVVVVSVVAVVVGVICSCSAGSHSHCARPVMVEVTLGTFEVSSGKHHDIIRNAVPGMLLVSACSRSCKSPPVLLTGLLPATSASIDHVAQSGQLIIWHLLYQKGRDSSQSLEQVHGRKGVSEEDGDEYGGKMVMVEWKQELKVAHTPQLNHSFIIRILCQLDSRMDPLRILRRESAEAIGCSLARDTSSSTGGLPALAPPGQAT